MIRLDNLFEPIFNLILDPNESFCSLLLVSPYDPKNHKHRTHEGSKEDKKEHCQWLRTSMSKEATS